MTHLDTVSEFPACAGTQRMGQVHLRAPRLQRIDRPVPAIGLLEHHLGIHPRPRHHPAQTLHIVGDLNRLQHLTGDRGPHHHAAPPMKIDTHELLACVL